MAFQINKNTNFTSLPRVIDATTETQNGNSSKLNDTHKKKHGYTLLLDRGTVLKINSIYSETNISPINIINDNLKKSVLPIKENCVTFESRFFSAVRRTQLKARRVTGGRGMDAFPRENVHLHVFIDEMCSKSELMAEERRLYNSKLNSLYTELSTTEKQLNSFKLKSDDYQKNLRLYEEANTALNKYIENLQSPLVNKGKTIPECKSRKQSTKKISILKERVNKALWFAKSFGVDLQELKVVDSAGSTHDLLKNTKPVGRYDQMPETEQDKVKSLLYVLDKFGVSDDAYHELAVYNNGLPRSYLIKQCRQDINDMCTITQTPGKSPGAQLTLKETLDRLLTRHDIEGLEIPVIQIKFAADGAKMSRMSNFLVLSLAVLNSGEEVMSVFGQHTIAIVDGKEDFISIQESLSDIFKDINSLLAKRNEIGYIPYQSSSGQKYLLELFLGGDMKFLLIALGLNAANANFACLYCKIEKKNRYDMSKSENFYRYDNFKRSIEEMIKLCNKKTANYGSIHPPLLYIDLDHVVVDELHLMMRIGDVLLRNLIENAINMDQKENLGKRSKSSKRVDQVVELIRSCGISFSIWENKVKDGRGDSIKNLDWTSPTGTEFKKILHLLPEKLRVSECVPENARDSLSKLWADFYALYSVMNAWSPSDEKIDGFFGSAQKWVSDFTSLRVCLEGFDFKYVTPYMHILVYHVSFFLRKYRSIKQFTGQGVEKCNDDIKMIYHRKSIITTQQLNLYE